MKKSFFASLTTGLLLLGFTGIGTADTLADETLSYAHDYSTPRYFEDSGEKLSNKLEGYWNHFRLEHNSTVVPEAAVYQSENVEQTFRYDRDTWNEFFQHEFTIRYEKDGSRFISNDNIDLFIYTSGISSLSEAQYIITGEPLADDISLEKSALSIDFRLVPEPATMLLFGTGLIGLAGLARRKQK